MMDENQEAGTKFRCLRNGNSRVSVRTIMAGIMLLTGEILSFTMKWVCINTNSLFEFLERKINQYRFEGSMTDTEVKINGKLAGAIHQGAFMNLNMIFPIKFNSERECFRS